MAVEYTRSVETTRMSPGILREDVYPEALNREYEPLQSTPLAYMFSRARELEINDPASQWEIVPAYVRKVLKDAGPANTYVIICSTDRDAAATVESVPDGVESFSNAIQKFACYRVYGTSNTPPEINQIIEISVPATGDKSIQCSLVRVTNDYIDDVSIQSEEVQDSSTVQAAFLQPPEKSIGTPVT